MHRAVAVLVALPVSIVGLSMAACGGDDDGAPGAGADAAPSPRPDASRPADARPAIQCPDDELGDLGLLDGGSGLQRPRDRDDPDGPQERSLLGDFGSILFSLHLYDGRGAFADGGATTGTFSLADEIASDTCGICLGFTLPAKPIYATLIPVSGSITLDSVDGRLTGSFQNLALQEPELSGKPDERGCTATATSGRFDVQVLVPPP